MLNFEAENVPVESLPKPCGHRVLIAPVKLRDKTEGGIALPQASLDIADNFRNIGKVLIVGDGAYDDKFFRGGRDQGTSKAWCRAGDVVVFNCHDGERLTIMHNGDRHNLRFITDSNIISVINDLSIIEQLL
jgi:co-chaperonin GroES (HSP10)